jgi:hypothetical protein
MLKLIEVAAALSASIDESSVQGVVAAQGRDECCVDTVQHFQITAYSWRCIAVDAAT